LYYAKTHNLSEAHAKELLVALNQGHPTASQRRTWPPRMWTVWDYECEKRLAAINAADEKAREESPERLRERIDELERRLEALALSVSRIDPP
jgi:polyhydroxyalkanoate synthesis regulator phasin